MKDKKLNELTEALANYCAGKGYVLAMAVTEGASSDTVKFSTAFNGEREMVVVAAYSMLGAIAEKLNVPLEDMLEAFSESKG